MDDNLIFDSLLKPVPGIRGDIDIIELEQEETSYLYFHDPMQYADPDFVLNREVGGLLSLFNGRLSVQKMTNIVNSNGSSDIKPKEILNFVQFLDRNRILFSEHFRQYASHFEEQFERKSFRRPACIQSTYPADESAVRRKFDQAFKDNGEIKHQQEIDFQNIKALYAPHIDFRVGMESYARSFSLLKYLQPRRVVLLGTSHYAGMYPEVYRNKPFIASRKTFGLPLGDVTADQDVLNDMERLKEQLGITFQDRAHRMEHSLELHLILLKYLWNHKFSIIPVLVGNFDELHYMKDGHLAKKAKALGRYLEQKFGDDPETLFLISGDLAHIGRKFGDQEPARTMFEEVQKFDRDFLHYAEKSDREALLNHIAERHDPYRICGFPPLYTFLSGFRNVKGTTVAYNLWDEAERESAVSYGAIVYEQVVS